MRNWNAIFDELASEPNTGNMARLLKELSQLEEKFEKKNERNPFASDPPSYVAEGLEFIRSLPSSFRY